MKARSWCILLALASVGCPASQAEPQPGSEGAAPAHSPGLLEPAKSAEPARAQSAEPPAPAPAPLLISAVGDCTLGSELQVRGTPGSFHAEMEARGNDYRYPFSGVLEVLSRDDLTIANLETTLSTRNPVSKGRYVFRGEPAYARILVEGSVEIVSVANNHSYDLGSAGLDETLSTLKAHSVGAFGFGHVDRRTIKGIEVINLGFTGGDPDLVLNTMKGGVKQHKRPDNLVIVSFHWGGEGSTEPNDDQRRLGRSAIDAGADLVLGHHPHVLQGIERRGGKEIVYSLGNFVFGGHSNPEDKDSIIYQATFALQEGKVVPVESRVVPVRISSVTDRNDFHPVLLDGGEKERVLGRMQRYSQTLAQQSPASAQPRREAAPASAR
jgi:poly-gamma-glutamate synthesis protein (capsule biosynthesis protein)